MSKCCPEVIVTAVTTAAIAMSRDLSANEIALLSSIFTQLGDTLATIATARDSCSEAQEPIL